MNSLLTDVSASQLRRAAALKEKIDRLQSELSDLFGAPQLETTRPIGNARLGSPSKRRRMSAAAKARIAAAAKLRWKKAKAAGKNRL